MDGSLWIQHGENDGKSSWRPAVRVEAYRNGETGDRITYGAREDKSHPWYVSPEQKEYCRRRDEARQQKKEAIAQQVEHTRSVLANLTADVHVGATHEPTNETFFREGLTEAFGLSMHKNLQLPAGGSDASQRKLWRSVLHRPFPKDFFFSSNDGLTTRSIQLTGYNVDLGGGGGEGFRFVSTSGSTSPYYRRYGEDELWRAIADLYSVSPEDVAKIVISERLRGGCPNGLARVGLLTKEQRVDVGQGGKHSLRHYLVDTCRPSFRTPQINLRNGHEEIIRWHVDHFVGARRHAMEHHLQVADQKYMRENAYDCISVALSRTLHHPPGDIISNALKASRAEEAAKRAAEEAADATAREQARRRPTSSKERETQYDQSICRMSIVRNGVAGVVSGVGIGFSAGVKVCPSGPARIPCIIAATGGTAGFAAASGALAAIEGPSCRSVTRAEPDDQSSSCTPSAEISK